MGGQCEGTYLVTHAFLGMLIESGRNGRGGPEGMKIVVNLTSGAAHLVIPGGYSYQACTSATDVNVWGSNNVCRFRPENLRSCA